MNKMTLDEILESIARSSCLIETLKTRNSDSLDFHTVAVWELENALRAAYKAGMNHQLDYSDGF